MELFDLHADIGYDVMQKRKMGMRNILNTFHVDKLRRGGIGFLNMVCCFEGHETWLDMQEMVLALKEEIDLCDEIDLVVNRDELLHLNGHMKAILSVEGMCGIQSDVGTKIEWLYQQGVRIGSLCWNDENKLATGVKGNAMHGLHPLGREVIDKMMELKMIVDVSHANEKTFWDIMDIHDVVVMATHSNARMLCDHPRNLWDEQLHAIRQHKGIVGIVSAPCFVAKQKENQDCAQMIAHVQHIMDIVGTDRVAFGFDYMDFYEGYEDVHVHELKDASHSQAIVEEMIRSDVPLQDMQMIALGNVIRFLCEHI